VAVANITFHALGVTVEAGQDVPDSDPVVKRYPDLFTFPPKPARRKAVAGKD
jgi:hypothetical protein